MGKELVCCSIPPTKRITRPLHSLPDNSPQYVWPTPCLVAGEEPASQFPPIRIPWSPLGRSTVTWI